MSSAEQTISIQCQNCGEWAAIWAGDYCVMCGGRVLGNRDMVSAPCDECGTPVLWPDDDDRSRGVMCPACIHALVSEAFDD